MTIIKQDPLSALARLAQGGEGYRAVAIQSYQIESRVYKGQTINLDGYTFVNCVFLNCTLITAKANFRILDCHVQNCLIYFTENALNAARLCSVLKNLWDPFPDVLRAALEADGGYTIG
jgi:hypothetical protein